MWLLFTRLVVPVSGEEANEEALQRYSTAGAEAIQRNDYAGAEQAYRQLLVLAPNLSEARSNLGLALYMQKKYESAREQFQTTLKAKPSLFVPNFFMARIFAHERKFQQALPLAEKARTLKPENYDACRLVASMYVGLSQNRRGIETYHQCLEKRPAGLETLYDLGAIYMNLARQAFDRLSQFPDNAFSSMIKSNHYFAQYEWNPSPATLQNTKIEYQRALERDSKLREARIRLGTLELQDDHLDAAAKWFREELAVDPVSEQAHFGLAQVAFNRGDITTTIRELGEGAAIRPAILTGHAGFVVRRPKEWLQQTQKVVSGSECKETLPCTYLRAVIARELSDSEQESAAQEEIAKEIQSELAKSAEPRTGAVSAKVATLESNDIVPRGLKLLRSKQYEAGTDMLLPVSSRPTADPQLQLEVAKALHVLEKYEVAAELLERAAARRRADPEPTYWLALAYQKAAQAKLQETAAIDPDSYRVHWLMGDLHFELERYEAAIQEYETALKKQPENSQLYLNLGNVYYRLARYSEATDCYRKSVQTDPFYATAQLMLGDALLTDRKVEEALPHLQTAMKLDPSLQGGNAKLAKALAAVDRFEEAVQELEKATSEDKDGSLYYQLSSYYRKLGQVERANHALQKSQELKKLALTQQQQKTVGSTGTPQSGEAARGNK